MLSLLIVIIIHAFLRRETLGSLSLVLPRDAVREPRIMDWFHLSLSLALTGTQIFPFCVHRLPSQTSTACVWSAKGVWLEKEDGLGQPITTFAKKIIIIVVTFTSFVRPFTFSGVSLCVVSSSFSHAWESNILHEGNWTCFPAALALWQSYLPLCASVSSTVEWVTTVHSLQGSQED